MNKPEEILEKLTEQMQNIIKEAQEEIKKIRANRLDPEIFKGILHFSNVLWASNPTPTTRQYNKRRPKNNRNKTMGKKSSP